MTRPFDGTYRVYDDWIGTKATLEKAGYRLPAVYDGPRPAEETGPGYHKSVSRRLLLDITRISDNRQFVAKRVMHHQASLALLAAKLPKDPRNHCVPWEDILEYDGIEWILIMPLLLPLGVPPFDTVGELLECLRQLFEGIQFMHEHRFTHGDIQFDNFMMSSSEMFPNGFQPTRTNRTRNGKWFHVPRSTRTRLWPRYYVIDFEYGWSCDFDDEGPAFNHKADYTRTPGQNPFPNDIHFLGSLLKGRILEHSAFKADVLHFLWPLTLDMLHETPSLRPTIDDVVWRFSALLQSLTSSQLRQSVQRYPPVTSWTSALRHNYRRLKYIALRVPPLPNDVPPPIRCIPPSLKSFYTRPLHEDEDDEGVDPKRRKFRELYRTPAHLRDPAEVEKLQPKGPRRMPLEELRVLKAKTLARIEGIEAMLREQEREREAEGANANANAAQDGVAKTDLAPPVPPKT
ncbi:hypothetical protein CYLTODRAFT_365730 [Cylindrobasidium torrendii FP15055 ss-10]|uniref:Protein kinase domain-containing protein n=1 Tax=Cylindrobasidium torrendii FP15055 ss-10 TaxID=1314674 RepID=A0A0D7BTL7_9AGAR|nr:hypothetical protein CYLTODRAFT_365730 [Cylindrobasidium torrendii FP15055 ss-10]